MTWPFPALASTALALLVDRLFGYPSKLQHSIGHPVEWLGWLINRLDAKLNSQGPGNRMRGAIAMVLIVIAAFLPAWLLANMLSYFASGWIIEALLASTLIAHSSLHVHVLAVHRALANSLSEARLKVSKIVGRDAAYLDESGIARATIESLAENASDGVVAPALCYAMFGLPGIAVYKAINTADSMIGHRSDRYLDFGWTAARLDDLVNLPFSRLTGLLLSASAWLRSKDRGWRVWEIMRRDAPKHHSPNAGWPEAAMAAALEIRLGGPRTYDGHVAELPWMGEGRTLLARRDIKTALVLFRRAMNLLFVAVLAVALLF